MSNLAELQCARAEECLTVDLTTGQLRLAIESCQGRVEDFLGFAARANPRRAFLFLSKVLGKHYPVRPANMEATHTALAKQVPCVEGPVVFIGMAETATGLGQGVFESWLTAHPGIEALYLQTTRYRVNGTEPLIFEESHSHAPRVFLHLPPEPQRLSACRAAKHVVLVDDELSTGNTFVNLVRVLRTALPALADVHLATIADFMGETRRTALSQIMGLPCTVGALLRGSWEFKANGATAASSMAQCNAGQEVWLEDTGYGRLGRSNLLVVPHQLLDSLSLEPVDGPTLVLGIGEFMHAAFALGRGLEQRGVDVRVQATTRSPILRWGAVKHVLSVPDTYGESLQNYLYNVQQPGQYARVLICHETTPDASLFELARMLKGRLIHFLPDDDAKEIPVC
ncbi:MAG: phosphoribosyltransferase domain-containing protein [Sulfuricellaceae bacterium]|nr:phosphoribosyltransferase domain-containing protein [Sulfuricellaceae bacterium]